MSDNKRFIPELGIELPEDEMLCACGNKGDVIRLINGLGVFMCFDCVKKEGK